MPKKIDKEKEMKFVEFYCEGDTQGNATQSCINSSSDLELILSTLRLMFCE